MKRKYLIMLLLLIVAKPVLADDVSIYGVSNIKVKPNVLIVFDNSGSMDSIDVPGEVYDPNKDYSYAGGKDRYSVFRFNKNNKTWVEFFPDIKNDDNNWQCGAAETALLEEEGF